MEKSNPRLLTLISATLLVVGVAFAQESSSPSETAITTADCESAWNQSSANSGCTTTKLVAEAEPGQSMVNICAVSAYCDKDGRRDTRSYFHGGPDGVKELVNCNGKLKLSDNCST